MSAPRCPICGGLLAEPPEISTFRCIDCGRGWQKWNPNAPQPQALEPPERCPRRVELEDLGHRADGRKDLARAARLLEAHSINCARCLEERA